MAAGDTVRHLTTLGLTPAEASVYLTLLDAPGARAPDLARCAGVSRSRVYAVIAALVERGLATERPGVYKRFDAVDLSTAVDVLARRARATLDEAAALVLNAPGPDAAARTVPQAASPDASACLRVLAGARSDVRALVRAGDFLVAPAIARAGAALAGGARVRVVLEPGVENPFRAHAAVEARRVPRLRASLLVVDESVAILSEPASGSGSAGAQSLTVAENARVARFLAHLFESVWAQAESTN